ncbi:MAG: carboxypeptidase regulatory-like domain-containing protein [Bacteroidota bacterium]
MRKANKEFELHAYNLAIKSYLKILDKKPNEAEAIQKVATAFMHLNQMSQAISWFEKAIELKAINPQLIFDYASALKAKGEYEKAKEWFGYYAEGNPEIGNHFVESCDFAIYRSTVPGIYNIADASVNTNVSDFGPAFYNGKLVFSSSRQDMKRSQNNPGSNWTGNAYNQLFVSEFVGGKAAKPKFFFNDLTNNNNIGPISFSADGKWVAYTKNTFVEGTRQLPASGIQLTLYIAQIDANGQWKTAQAFPYNSDSFSNGFPSLSADGSMLYFASDRPDGFGGYDIYQSKKMNGSWSTPENLGPVVNTTGNEISPFYNGRDLFFSSDWHPGFGGQDIFRAAMTNDRWTKVFHLGNEVNSSRDDYGFIYSEALDLGYFVSNRTKGKGYEDIYRAKKVTDKIIITVLDEKANQPITGAIIDFTACGERMFNTNASGVYSFQALPGLSCSPTVRKEGYAEQSFKLSTGTGASVQKIEVKLLKLASDVIASATGTPVRETPAAPPAAADGKLFAGKVVDYSNNQLMEGVVIRATNQQNGAQVESATNKQGAYVLPLNPGDTYIVRFSKAGFRDINKTVKTGEIEGDLGVLPLLPSGTSIASNTRTPAAPPASTPTANTGNNSPAASSAFAIQVAAVLNKPNVDISSYEQKLRSIGKVYKVTEGNATRIRVAGFKSREEAASTLGKVKNLGYGSAFLVTEEDATTLAKLNSVKATNPTTPPATSTPVAPPAKTTGTAAVSYSPYKVRLGTYRNMSSFDAAKVENLGRIEKYRWSGYTIVVLTDFVTRADAEQALKQARAKGFKDAVLATKQNGRLKSVR